MLSRPILEMFWVAEYNNGRALPQYNPFTIPPSENRFECVDHKNVIRLWWIPITPDIARFIPGTRYNPRLQQHCIETKGAKGYVVRRCKIDLKMGKNNGKLPLPQHRVVCYVLGIEGGYRKEIYPDGSIKEFSEPRIGETQDILHHG